MSFSFRSRFASSAVLASALLLSTTAQAEFNAHIGLSTEYVRDGISQTNGKFALESGLTYLHDSGVYGGVWASDVNHNDDSTNLEYTGFAGFNWNISNAWLLDTSVTSYNFNRAGSTPADSQNYNEVTARLLLDQEWTFGYRQAYDYLGSDSQRSVIEAAYVLQSDSFSMDFYLGRHQLSDADETINFGRNERDNYFHLRIGVERSYNDYDYRLTLDRTNLGSGFDAGTIISFGVQRYWNF